MNVPRAVIFDFDGTLADSFSEVFEIYNDIAPEYGLARIPKGQQALLRGTPARELIKKYGVAWWKVPLLVRRVLSELGKRQDALESFPGIPEAIHALKREGFVLAIVTTNTQNTVETFLARHDMNVFDLVSSERSLFAKSKRLRHTLKALEVRPVDAVYVGDEVRDVEAAHRLGIRAVAVSWGYNDATLLKSHEPEYLVNSVQELRDVLCQLR